MTQTSMLGDRQNIDIGAIEKELAALWKQPTAESNLPAGPHMMRACVMTLVIPVIGQAAANAASTAVTELTDRFPNRAIVIDTRPSTGDDRIDAWVQANCQMPGTGRAQICGEQISIEASGAALERVPGTVLPLLVTDVPVVLWWSAGVPTDSPLFPRLTALSDRLVVDSATFDAPEHQVRNLIELSQQRQALSDLAWGRLTPWRELTAQFFDSPSTSKHLQEIEQVTLRYHTTTDSDLDRLQPLLLVGWLAAKLGWNVLTPAPAQPNATFTFQRSDNGTVTVQLEAAEVGATGDHTLTAISLRCSHGTFAITRSDDDRALATAEIADTPPVRRTVRLERRDRADLLAEELRLFGRDKGYEGALNAVAAVLGV